MASKYIALIVVLGIWILLLVIFGILSWVYHLKHRVLIAQRQNYFKDYLVLQSSLTELVPLTLDLQLKASEQAFVYEKDVVVYATDLVKAKKTSRRYKKYDKASSNQSFDEWEESAEQTSMGLLRWTYSLKATMPKVDQPTFKGTLLVTNHRILFFNKETNQTLRYGDLLRVDPVMVNLEKEFVPGFSLATKNGVYEVVNHDLKTPVILEKLRKESGVQTHGIKP